MVEKYADEEPSAAVVRQRGLWLEELDTAVI
jgi:hypothetical protein